MGHCRTPRGMICATQRLFYGNNFVTSATLAEECALLNAVLVYARSVGRRELR